MKKLGSLLLTMSMALSCITAGAAPAEIVTSHVAFDGEPGALTVKALSRDLSGQNTPTALFCVTYDGNDMVTDVKMVSETNKFLEINNVDSTKGIKTKAFIWNMQSMAPVAVPATYGATADVNLAITFDGVPFETYMGEAFNINKTEYTKNLDVTDGKIVIPYVRAEASDNSAAVKVKTTKAVQGLGGTYTTAITVENGKRTSTLSSAKYDGKMDYSVYSKEYTKTYTITYSVPEDYIYDTDFTSDVYNHTTTGKNGFDWQGGTNSLNNRWEHSVTVPSGTTQKVTMTLTASAADFRQNAVVILKAKDGGDAICDESGNPLTWTEDNWVIEAYENGTPTYGEKCEDTVTQSTGKNLPVYRKLRNNGGAENPMVTGSRRAPDREPIYGAEMTGFSSDLLGSNYIVFGDEGRSIERTISFNINKDTDIIVLSAANPGQGDKPITSVKAGDTALTVQTQASAPVSRYQNPFYVPTVGWLIKNGYITRDRIIIAGTQIKLPWAVVEKAQTNGMVYCPSIKAESDYVSWNDRMTPADLDKFIQFYVSTDDHSEIVKDFTNLSGVTNDPAPQMNIFEDGARLYMDRDYKNAWNGVSVVDYHPEVFEMDGLPYIAVGWDTKGQANWTNAAANPWYSFKVTQDCEIWMFWTNNSNIENLWALKDGWTALNIVHSNPANGVSYYLNPSIFRRSGAGDGRMRGMVYKKFKAGETVTIRAFGIANNSSTITVIRPM